MLTTAVRAYPLAACGRAGAGSRRANGRMVVLAAATGATRRIGTVGVDPT